MSVEDWEADLALANDDACEMDDTIFSGQACEAREIADEDTYVLLEKRLFDPYRQIMRRLR